LDHQADTLTERISRFTDVMTAAPGEHDGQADGHEPAAVNWYGVTIR
jgi:hypothetical protein